MQRARDYFIISILLLMYGCSSSSTRLIVEEKTDAIIRTSSNIEYSDFWEAMSNLDFDYFANNNLNQEYHQFEEGLIKVRANDFNTSENTFRELLFSSSDSLIKKNSKEVLSSIIFSQSKWYELIQLEKEYGKSDSSDKTNLNLSRSYIHLEKEKYTFPSESTVIPFTLSFSGSPIILVKINGKEYNFWLDTGAGLSVIASDIAEDCGIKPLNSESSIARTGTSINVNIKPIVIDKLEIGDVKINNHPSILIDESDLKFKLLGIFTLIKIDGIIGWNAIRNMNLSIDYKKKEIIISKPVKREISDRNFFWLDYPIVSLNSEKGVSLLFKLDTGSDISSISENIFPKINPQNVQIENKTIGSAGGNENIESKVIPELTIILGKNSLNFKNISTHKSNNNSFLKTDGVLGSDILKGAVITIDYMNGRFDYKYINAL